MRLTQSAVIVLFVLMTIGASGCEWVHERVATRADSEAQGSEDGGSDADTPTAVPGRHPDRAEGEPPPGAAAADVIRTRIAWRQHAEEGVPWPTPTPPPPLPVTVAGGVAWATDIGLMWTESAAGLFEYQDAVDHCRGSSAGGYQDWVVPSITELELLLATEYYPSWIDDVPRLWSSTAHDIRGVITVVLPEVTRSHQAIGMAHVVCVRRIQ